MTHAGSVYGGALYRLCREEGLEELVMTEFAVLDESFAQTPEFVQLLDCPALTKAERCSIVDESFGSCLQPYLLNFLKILTEKGYMHHFADCCSAYRHCYHKDNNILPVTAVTVQAMTKEQAARITQKLIAQTGKAVQLHNRLDSTVIGGIRLEYDGKRLDDTIANRIDGIRSLLKNTVL